MSTPLLTTLILSAVSGVLQALGWFVRPLRRLMAALLLVWIAAALPILFFLNVPAQDVLLFCILSAALGLIFSFGGRPT